MILLRQILSECEELIEDFKWMHPCYTFYGKNVVLIHSFKSYCALLFHKGVLLSDTRGILIQQTKNVQSARQLRFTHIDEIYAQKDIIKEYVKEAIALEKSGKKVVLKTTADYPIPQELRDKFQENRLLEKAFYALSPGRQRAYLFYFTQAKQSTTRLTRIKKYIPKILEGNGIHD